ncbi:hypothetical protein [Burkholderia pseudomallei]|uniref:hypothetical protein n=1 Tax=Burkholderia pseudomallei TaxID=28450 RepID=UPI0003D806CD|nr:hypothetical protein [Burkholderia pseudomallei]AHE28463.1 hypothetical protein BBJ_190 [Burkholderia pseudomallei NCTC 13178]KGC48919.1 hypothetical protein DO65_101 [Burkholderia pseudomallei]
MDDAQYINGFPQLTVDQIRDLAAAAREHFGPGLSRAGFNDKLAMLLEDVPGFEVGNVDARLIDSAWATYGGRPSQS